MGPDVFRTPKPERQIRSTSIDRVKEGEGGGEQHSKDRSK